MNLEGFMQTLQRDAEETRGAELWIILTIRAENRRT